MIKNKNKKTEICKFCDEKVITYNNSRSGHMNVNNHLFHFDCVVKYNYQKFCKEIIEMKKNTELNDDITS